MISEHLKYPNPNFPELYPGLYWGAYSAPQTPSWCGAWLAIPLSKNQTTAHSPSGLAFRISDLLTAELATLVMIQV